MKNKKTETSESQIGKIQAGSNLKIQRKEKLWWFMYA
jgi:hypothetical protein